MYLPGKTSKGLFLFWELRPVQNRMLHCAGTSIVALTSISTRRSGANHAVPAAGNLINEYAQGCY